MFMPVSRGGSSESRPLPRCCRRVFSSGERTTDLGVCDFFYEPFVDSLSAVLVEARE